MNKKLIVTVSAVLLVLFVIVGVFFIEKHNKETRQRTIENSYQRQNFAFHISGRYGMGGNGYDKYHNFDDIRFSGNLYAWLLLYKHDTGNTLTMEEIDEYLSNEYEDDGSLRMSKNYPQIQEYIDFICYADGYTKTGEKIRINDDSFFAQEGRLGRFDIGVDLHSRNVLPEPYNINDTQNEKFVSVGHFPNEIVEQAVDWVFESGWMDLKTDEEYDEWRVKYKSEEYSSFREKYKHD